MQCLIGLASSSGTGEQWHDLPKEDGLWPACSHNRRLHSSWKVHKAKCTFPGFVRAGDIFGSIQSKLVGLLQYYAGYHSRNNKAIWKIWGACRKDYILKPEGIDYLCLGRKGARTYYLGVCYSEGLGSQRNGYLDPLNFSLLLNPAPKCCWRLWQHARWEELSEDERNSSTEPVEVPSALEGLPIFVHKNPYRLPVMLTVKGLSIRGPS